MQGAFVRAIGAGHIPPCHCEGVRSTLKTLACDCGNPVQCVCGRMPAVLFYLLDRHALLAMTGGRKCVFLNALTTPGCAHPSNGGELATYRRGAKSPSAEGWHVVPGWLLSWRGIIKNPPWGGLLFRRCDND